MAMGLLMGRSVQLFHKARKRYTYIYVMILFIVFSVQLLPQSQKTVYLTGHGIAPRIKRSAFATKTETVYLGHGIAHQVIKRTIYLGFSFRGET